jgi:membrane-associated protease RseP (regulator of RpoE activity)
MSVRSFRGAVEWALMVGLVFGAGAIAQAQQEEEQPNDRVIKIGRADEEAANVDGRVAPLNRPTDGAIVQQEIPKYWIGLRGVVIGDDDPLRAHVDLPAHQGLLVHEIVPDSPAAKAGLKKYDILLRANDVELAEMNNLIEMVGTEGEKKGQITLDVIRHGERETVYVTPEERPADQMLSQDDGGQNPLGGGLGVPQGWERMLEGRGQPFDFRNFGPGIIVGEGGGFANIPNGVSVSVHKQDGKPAEVTVKRGEETWTVVGDDPESLKQLPEDLRPFVEQMLRGGSPMGMNFNFDGLRGRGFEDGRLRDRLDEMEQRMNQLFERLGENPPVVEPKAEQEEAQ